MSFKNIPKISEIDKDQLHFERNNENLKFRKL